MEFEIECTDEVKKMGITQGFYNLHIVDIRSCPEMKHVTWLILAPNLKKMRIYFCPNMKEIINSEKLGEVPVEMVQNLNPFARLEHLELEELRNLKNIYSSALHFPLRKK